jgi:DNA topoisomerase-3
MQYKVIIAEKPSVAGSIAKIVGATSPHREGPSGYLEGNGYKVTWAFGHLVGLKSPEQMGFDRTVIPMFPEKWETKILGRRNKEGKEEIDPMVNKQMKTLENLFAGADSIIVATDAGREGELIFRYIYEYLHCKTPFERLWISSLTDEAIRKGLSEIKDGHSYDDLSNAAHARSEADWLVGYNASKALRIASGFHGTLSLGRVQTPTLGMICQRYEENTNFKPVPYWVLNAYTGKGGTSFTVLSEKKYESAETAESARKAVENEKRLTVTSVDKKRTATKPPLLFDLTALQRAANGKYSLTADETLKIAQSLYEKKYLSYPRTGSKYIPEDVYKTLPSLIAKFENYGTLGTAASALRGKHLCKKSVDDSKVTDHHALLPTGNVPTDLVGTEKKVFDLVCGRMLEAFGDDFITDVTTVSLQAAGVVFKAHGSVPISLGWKAVYGAENGEESSKEKDDDEKDERLPELVQGDILPVGKVENIRKETKPQPIYTDSSLLGEMETCGKKIDDEQMREAMKDVGLGTPATRAATIEALIIRKYVMRDAKKLLPTELGMQIWTMVKGRKIADVKTTGEWERDLAFVERGKRDVEEFNQGIKQFASDIVTDLMTNCKPFEGASAYGEATHVCPFCGKQMLNQRYSINCNQETGGCGFKIPREICGKKLPDNAIEALCKGKETTLIKGFLSKSGKKFDAKLIIKSENNEHKLSFAFENKPQGPTMTGKICPVCGKTLQDTTYNLKCECGFSLNKTICNKLLNEKEIDTLLAGGIVQAKGLVSKSGKKFNAGLKYNKEKKGIDFMFDKK